jgi:hypothetical protein
VSGVKAQERKRKKDEAAFEIFSTIITHRLLKLIN